MQYMIEYVRYNNNDFIDTVFSKTIEDAEMLKAQLEKLRHVSNVRIVPVTEKDGEDETTD